MAYKSQYQGSWNQAAFMRSPVESWSSRTAATIPSGNNVRRLPVSGKAELNWNRRRLRSPLHRFLEHTRVVRGAGFARVGLVGVVGEGACDDPGELILRHAHCAEAAGQAEPCVHRFDGGRDLRSAGEVHAFGE